MQCNILKGRKRTENREKEKKRKRGSTTLHPSERRLRAPALNRFSQKATFRNSPLFLQLALYMVERPQPYTLPLPVPQVCTMPECSFILFYLNPRLFSCVADHMIEKYTHIITCLNEPPW